MRSNARTASRVEFAAALLLDLVGAGVALLVSSRTWQSAHFLRSGLGDIDAGLTGRNIDSSPTALALAALAGIVALIATRGLARRVVGGLVAVVGVALVWRSLRSAGAVSASRARSIVEDHHQGIALPSAAQHVAVHAAWPVLSAIAGALVMVAGVLVAVRGHRWQSMAARYSAPSDVDDADARKRADLALWNAIERGDDPTTGA
jgi:uncharacterized membrane protein (TIGR02234 family)